jgi:hypothetical protein
MKVNLVISVLSLLLVEDSVFNDKVSTSPSTEKSVDASSDKDFLDDDWDSSSSCLTCDKTSLKMERNKLCANLQLQTIWIQFADALRQ